MINPQNISHITKSTLKKYGVHSPSMERLIKGTFAAQTGLAELFNHKNETLGLMAMPENVFEDLVLNYLTHNQSICDRIYNTCGVDVLPTEIASLKEDLESNISFQVLVTYFHYTRMGGSHPQDDLEDITTYYVKLWKHQIGFKPEDPYMHFIVAYEERFLVHK